MTAALDLARGAQARRAVTVRERQSKLTFSILMAVAAWLANTLGCRASRRQVNQFKRNDTKIALLRCIMDREPIGQTNAIVQK